LSPPSSTNFCSISSESSFRLVNEKYCTVSFMRNCRAISVHPKATRSESSENTMSISLLRNM